LEEIIPNAIYHKSYDQPNPIEIQVHSDKIEVLSFPGPLPPIDNKTLKKKRIVARDYRNRKIGEFLKELHLTEGRGTGFPIFYRSLKENGSPEPVFEKDDDRTYFLATLYIHPDANQGFIKEKDEINIAKVLRDINTAVDIDSLNVAINLLAGITQQELSDRVGDRDAVFFAGIDRDRVRDIERVRTALDYCKKAKKRKNY
jgi:ATP-dependent DNA helicase RecG